MVVHSNQLLKTCVQVYKWNNHSLHKPTLLEYLTRFQKPWKPPWIPDICMSSAYWLCIKSYGNLITASLFRMKPCLTIARRLTGAPFKPPPPPKEKVYFVFYNSVVGIPNKLQPEAVNFFVIGKIKTTSCESFQKEILQLGQCLSAQMLH